MTSRMLLAVTIAALAGAAALVGHPPASRGLQAVTLGIDVDPGAAPANSATSLGTIEGCKSLDNNAGSQFEIDVYFDGIPSGEDMAGFNYEINFDDTRFKVADENHSFLLTAAAGSSPLKLGDDVPNATSPHLVAEADFGTTEQGPASGVLGRVTLEVLPGAPDGVADLSLSNIGVFNSLGEDIPIDQISSGSIALGAACADDLPPPTSSPKPTTPPAATPPPEATPSPQATPPPEAKATPSPDTTPTPAVLDADEDRVGDAKDQCADTPADVSVDASGCSARQLRELTQQAKEQLLDALEAGLNLGVSLDKVVVGGSTAVFAVFADENEKPVSGVDVTFKIKEQPGSDADLKGKAKVTKTSNARGFANATLNVGSTPGEIVVSATAEGQTETVTVTVVGEGEVTPAPSPTAGGEEEGAAAGGEEEDGGGTGSWPYAVAGIGGGLAAIAVGGGLWWRRRRATGGP